MKKRKSLKYAILLPVIIVLLLGIIVEIIILAVQSSKTVTHLSDELILRAVSHRVYEFNAMSEGPFGAALAIAPVVQNSAGKDNARQQVIDMLQDVVLTNDAIAGMWTCWEPDAFDGNDAQYAGTQYHDGTGRFIPYIYISDGKTLVEPLVDYTDPVNGAYYLDALNSKKINITDPYWYQAGSRKIYVYSIAIPLLDDSGKAIGVMGADIDMSSVLDKMKGANVLDDGYVFTLSPGGKIATHKDPNMLLQDYKSTWLSMYENEMSPLFTKWGEFSKSGYSDILKMNVTLSAESISIGGTDKFWIVCAVIPQTTVDAPVVNIVTVTIIVALLLVLIVGVTIYIIVSRSLKPLGKVIAASKDIVAGNLSINLTVDSNDEIGDLTSAFISVKDTFTKLVHDINETSAEMNKGNLNAMIDDNNYDGEYKGVARSFNTTIQSLIDDTMMMLDAFKQLGEGDFKFEMKQLPGQKAVANEQYIALRNNLSSLNMDLSNLIHGAINGELNTRIDITKYHGDWRLITQGLNDLLQAINTPIDEANAILSQLSAGNFDVHVGADYKGSFAMMMASFDTMVKSIRSYIDEITQILGSIAEGDLRNSISREYLGRFDMIKQSINNIGVTLRNTVTEIHSSSDNVLSGARQVSESSMELANGASMQASSVQELNASINIINEQARRASEKAQKANEVSQHSISSAKEGNEVMEKMLKSMEEIKTASANISKILNVIDDIAFQTSLLALNASVEAARAGEQGKGFAIVANEVRTLAGKSAKAASDTASLIEDTINKIGEGTKTARLTADSLHRIINDIDSVSQLINDIYATAKEQTEGVSEISVGIGQISEVVQRNSSTSEEAAAAAQELNSQSELLSQMVSNFKV